MSNALVSFNIELRELKNTPELVINVIIYRALEDLFSKLDRSINNLEKKYSEAVWQYLPQTKENIRLAAHGWVKFIEIHKEVVSIAKEYDGYISNLKFNYNHQSKYIVNSKIDLLLLSKKGDISLLTVTPYQSTNRSLGALNNIDTAICVDYLTEANLQPDRIIEISYDANKVNKQYHRKDVYNKGGGKKVYDLLLNRTIDDGANVSFCQLCPFNTKCNITTILK